MPPMDDTELRRLTEIARMAGIKSRQVVAVCIASQSPAPSSKVSAKLRRERVIRETAALFARLKEMYPDGLGNG